MVLRVAFWEEKSPQKAGRLVNLGSVVIATKARAPELTLALERWVKLSGCGVSRVLRIS